MGRKKGSLHAITIVRAGIYMGDCEIGDPLPLGQSDYDIGTQNECRRALITALSSHGTEGVSEYVDMIDMLHGRTRQMVFPCVFKSIECEIFERIPMSMCDCETNEQAVKLLASEGTIVSNAYRLIDEITAPGSPMMDDEDVTELWELYLALMAENGKRVLGTSE